MASRQAETSSTTDSLLDSATLIQGALFGAVAYLAGYVITYVLVAVDDDLGREVVSSDGFLRDGATELGFGGLDPTATEFAGWIFYNAHFVDIVQYSEATSADESGELGVEQSSNVLADAATQLPAVVYYVVPVLVVTAAGFVLARRVDPPQLSDSITAGATLALGYLPLAVLGRFLFEVSDTVTISNVRFSVSMAPDLQLAVVVAGLVVPILFGAIGAALGTNTE